MTLLFNAHRQHAMQVADFLQDTSILETAAPLLPADPPPAALFDALSQPFVVGLLKRTPTPLTELLTLLPQRHHVAVLRARAKPDTPIGTVLELSAPHIPDATRTAFLDALPTVPAVSTLRLPLWPLGDPASAAALARSVVGCAALRTLHLSEPLNVWLHLSPLLAELARLPSLRALHLWADPPPPGAPGGPLARRRAGAQPARPNSGPAVAAALAALTQLSELSIVRLSAWGVLDELPEPPATPPPLALTALQLSGSDLAPDGAAPARLFPMLRGAAALRALDVTSAGLTCATFPAFAASLPPLPGLTRLSLAGNRVKRGGLPALVALLAPLQRLEHLNLSTTSLLHNTTVDFFPALAALTALETLNLSNTVLNRPGALGLAAALPALPLLRDLDVSENGIPEAGLLALVAAVRSLTRLTRLWLWGNDQRPTIQRALAEWSVELARVAYEPEGGWGTESSEGGEWCMEDPSLEGDIQIVYADSSESSVDMP